MYWAIPFYVLHAAFAATQIPSSPLVSGEKPSETVTAHRKRLEQLVLRGKYEDVVQQLERESEFDFTGHPVSLGAIVAYLDSSMGWNVRTIVDESALARHGTNLDNVASPDEIRAGGISRRSSLRFVLDFGGVAYYVGDKCLIVTTKQTARVKWIGQLRHPTLNELCAPSIRTRRDAAFAAGFWHLDAGLWIKPLATALKDCDRQVAFDAAFALGEIGPQASGAVNSLVDLLKSQDLRLREAAVVALAKIGPSTATRLLALIDDPDATIALAASKSFRLMGSVASEYIPKLIKAAQRHADNQDLREGIGEAIAGIDIGNTISVLCELLKSQAPEIRAFSAYTIAKLGPRGGQCAEDLLRLLSDQNLQVRRDAAYALARIDLPADTPTPALEAASNDEDRSVSLWAAEALRVIKSNR